ncbi:hypothetical protein GW17_00001555 [Ensete ventricosum]|nr:hypothetical protein GW17_00001555 [Ensete ventricosum]
MGINTRGSLRRTGTSGSQIPGWCGAAIEEAGRWLHCGEEEMESEPLHRQREDVPGEVVASHRRHGWKNSSRWLAGWPIDVDATGSTGVEIA